MLLIFLQTAALSLASPVELKDDGDGLTGPQPSIIGSVDKVFKQVNNFDQKECLQKMICEFMGKAEDVVVNSVNSQFGGQSGQIVQNGINQFQSNPNQFVQSNQFGQNGPFVQAVTSEIQGNNIFQNGQQLVQSGQQFLQNGQQLLQTGQQFIQTPLPQGGGNRLVQVQHNGNSFLVPQSQLYTTQNQGFAQQSVPQQFHTNQQFQANQQFQTNQQSGSGNSLLDGIVDGLAGAIATATGKKRKKRQTTAHGQAIRVMQSLGLSKMGAYPYVRAAIIGHANKKSPQSCQQLYRQCPSGTDQLLNYLNNHNGGLFSNTLPSVSNEVGSLFPGLSSLPQVAASTFLDLESSSSNSVGTQTSSQSGSGGVVNGLVDTLAGFIAQVTG